MRKALFRRNSVPVVSLQRDSLHSARLQYPKYSSAPAVVTQPELVSEPCCRPFCEVPVCAYNTLLEDHASSNILSANRQPPLYPVRISHRGHTNAYKFGIIYIACRHSR